MSFSATTNEDRQFDRQQGVGDDNSSVAPSAARIADLAVLMTGSAGDEAVVGYADTIASAFGAHLDAFFANHIPLPPIPAGPGSDALAGMIVEQTRRTGDGLEQKIRERLSRLAARWELRRDDGMLGELVTKTVRLAGTSDLFVISQETSHSATGKELLEAVLFTAGSGVLLVPAGLGINVAFPRTILVGWRDTPECAHAIAAAMPFLQRAEQVVLTSVAEAGDAHEHGREPMADMARHLARHDVRVETRELPSWKHPSQALMREAEALGADMIVIGAYGHSRMRQLFLGGVTKNLLRECGRPVLLAH